MANSFDVTTLLGRSVLVIGAFGLTALAYFGVRWAGVQLNPILFIRDDPATQVYIDGELVKFDGRTFDLHPWNEAYVVETHSVRGVERRQIYPWDEASDSGTVVIGKKGIQFNMKNVATH